MHERIRAAILNGELDPGATIAQHALAEMFATGRTPLREALRLLQREGLVVAQANRPVRIAELTADKFEELCLVRIALEAVAIRITVPTLTSDDFAELEACMARMDHYQKAGDRVGMRAPHRAFHSRLVAGCGPGVSARLAELADHAERYRVAFGRLDTVADRRDEHRVILDAAADGDPDLAANHLVFHYAHTGMAVFSALDPDRDLRRLRMTIRAVAPSAQPALG